MGQDLGMGSSGTLNCFGHYKSTPAYKNKIIGPSLFPRCGNGRLHGWKECSLQSRFGCYPVKRLRVHGPWHVRFAEIVTCVFWQHVQYFIHLFVIYHPKNYMQPVMRGSGKLDENFPDAAFIMRGIAYHQGLGGQDLPSPSESGQLLYII